MKVVSEEDTSIGKIGRNGSSIEQLSTQHKKIKLNLPKLMRISQTFTFSQYLSTVKPETEKARELWTDTATGWSRSVQPVYSIPKAKRFQKSNCESEQECSELPTNIATRMDEKGIFFSQEKRSELFKIVNTPSPSQYQCKRYLETIEGPMRNHKQKRIKQLVISSNDHIKGGTIGNFKNYSSLYDPQIKRTGYNEKITKEKEREKLRLLKIHKNVTKSQS